MNFDAKAPPSLLDLQKWFSGILARPLRTSGEYGLPIYEASTVDSIEQKITPSHRLSAAQRIGIYNQQYWFRLFLLMQECYPTVTRLFGIEDFNLLIVEPYLQKYPPDHWSLDLLGSKLPRWIEEEYREEDKALILSVAQTDEIYERLTLVRALPFVKDGNLWEKTLYLQPFVAVLELEADLFAFREEMLKQEPEYWIENDFPKIDGSRKQDFVVYRDSNEIRSEKISPAQKIFLNAFQTGACIDEALSLIDSKMDDSKIRNWFQICAERGWFTTASFR